MTRDKLVDHLMRRLGGRKETSNRLRNFIIEELQLVISEILEQEGDLPWFLIEEKSFTTTALQEYSDLDASYLLAWEEGGFYFQETDGTSYELVIDDWDAIRNLFRTFSTPSELYTKPRYGTVIGERLYMRPIPDAVYTIKYWQYGKDDAVDLSGEYGNVNANNESLWMKHASDLLIAEIGTIVTSTIIKDKEAAANFAVLNNRARHRLEVKNVMKKEELKQRFMENE